MTTSRAACRASADWSIACWRSLRRRSAIAGIVDGDHAALAAGDDLARVKGEAGGAERADRPPPVQGADRAGGVLDEDEAVALGEVGEGVHVRRQADLVDRHHGLGPRRQPALDVSGIEVAGGGSMSAKTGVAPHCQTAFAVAMNESEGTITSSPGPTPAA